MRLENAQDPRRVLCERKYFGLRPQPLERYLYGLSLSQIAERVFWLHWDEGNKRGDFISEIPIRLVAQQCNAHPSSVTRAYQALTRAGLLRRQDPGRDLSMPFDQAIAVTEVLLPHAALAGLLGAPNRKLPSDSAPRSEAVSDAPKAEIPAPVPCVETDLVQAWTECFESLKSRVSEQDFTAYFRTLQVHPGPGSLTLFVPNRFVKEWIEQQALTTIQELLGNAGVRAAVCVSVGARPSPEAAPSTVPAGIAPKAQTPRRLNPFCQAQLRKELSKLGLGSALPERLREVTWSIEEGALASPDLTIQHAMNKALKLVRVGVWTRPNRMPPNGRLVAA